MNKPKTFKIPKSENMSHMEICNHFQKCYQNMTQKDHTWGQGGIHEGARHSLGNGLFSPTRNTKQRVGITKVGTNF